MSCGIEIETFLDAHAAWLRSETSVREVGGATEVTTPYLDRHNDHIQVLVRRSGGGGFVITDGGRAARELGMSGRGSPQRQRELLLQILGGFPGVRLGDADRLEVLAVEGDFAPRMHGLVQAVLAADGLARWPA